MNITLNADDELVAKARAYAQAHDTTLNQLIRDYLSRVTGQLEPEAAAVEFADVARHRGGCSDDKTAWSRAALHARPGKQRP